MKNVRVMPFAANAKIMLHSCSIIAATSCLTEKHPPGIVQHPYIDYQTKFEESRIIDNQVM